MKRYQHYLNGRYVFEDELLVSPRDLGFSRSFGVFDYLRTYNGQPFKLKEHIERLLRSAELINLKHAYAMRQLVELVQDVLDKNNDGNEKQIKIMLSGGISDFVYQAGEPTLIIIVDMLRPKKQEIYETGIRVNLVKFSRYMPVAKTTNYIEAVIQTEKGMREGAYEPVYYSEKQVHEGANSNIFAVKGEKIYTPKNNILYGITRGVLVNELKNKLNIIEEDFDLTFLLNAEEVFLTSSGKEIVPMVKVDDRLIGNGRVGDKTKYILREFREFANNGNW